MMRIFGTMMLTMGLAALVDSYSINYFDCRVPKGISRYDVSRACEEERMNDLAKQIYYFLQKKEIKKTLLLDNFKPKLILKKIRKLQKKEIKKMKMLCY